MGELQLRALLFVMAIQTGAAKYREEELTSRSGHSTQDSKSIKCYNEKTGGKFQECLKDNGFETCFSKYDSRKLTVYIKN